MKMNKKSLLKVYVNPNDVLSVVCMAIPVIVAVSLWIYYGVRARVTSLLPWLSVLLCFGFYFIIICFFLNGCVYVTLDHRHLKNKLFGKQLKKTEWNEIKYIYLFQAIITPGSPRLFMVFSENELIYRNQIVKNNFVRFYNPFKTVAVRLTPQNFEQIRECIRNIELCNFENHTYDTLVDSIKSNGLVFIKEGQSWHIRKTKSRFSIELHDQNILNVDSNKCD